MSEEAKKIAEALQGAVNEEMLRKAKLGYKAVIADERGHVKVLSAKYVVRKMRLEGLF
jgi:hypothetical protein